MDRLELRAAARAVARSTRTSTGTRAEGNAPRVRAQREAPTLPEVAIDEEIARRACAPMGALQSIVVSRTSRNHARTFYVIVPDPALAAEYERLGLQLVPGCRVLVDAAALKPLAVLSVVEPGASPAPRDAPAGFNPYFDLPGA